MRSLPEGDDKLADAVLAAAIFKWFVGAPLLIAPEPLLAFLPSHGGVVDPVPGRCYAFTAEELQRYRPLIWIAVAGKLDVVAIFALAFMQGFAPPRAFALALGGLAFGLAFLVSVLTYPKGVPRAELARLTR